MKKSYAIVLLCGLLTGCLLPGLGWAQTGAPSWRWAQGFRTTQSAGPAALAVDSAGNTYAAGSFNTFLPLGAGVSFTPQSGYDGFLAKFGPTGALLWARQLSGGGTQVFSRLKLVPGAGGGLLYVGGTLAAGTNTFGTQTVSAPTRDACIFTACVDLQGQLQWVRPLVSPAGTALLFDMDLDASGNLYLLGSVRGTVPVGPFTLTTPANPGEETQLFWAKFSPGGVAQWVRQTPIGPQANHELPATSLKASAQGDAVYLLGGIGFGATAFAGLPLPPALGGTDVLVTKCDGQGRARWLRRSGGAGGWNNPGKAVLRANGQLAVGLTFSGTAQFGTYTFTTPPGAYRPAVQVLDSAGSVVWATAPLAAQISDLLTDASGNLYAFTFADASTARSVTITSYSPQGNVRWTQASNGQGEYGAIGALGANGHLSLAGMYQTGAGFGPFSLAPYRVNGVGAESFYLTQLGASLATRVRAPVGVLSAYPNPAHGYLYVPALLPGTRVELRDAVGRLACETTVSAAAEVLLRGLAAGFYTLRATDKQGRSHTVRVTVE